MLSKGAGRLTLPLVVIAGKKVPSNYLNFEMGTSHRTSQMEKKFISSGFKV
jgi:hypothetical protein